jgi:hypothetical protein
MGRRPVNAPYTITTEFGVPDDYALFKVHSGVDYAVATGTNVYAPASGRVIYIGEHPTRGRMVGIFDGENTHRLMHNTLFEVAVGEQVKEGQLVAKSGGGKNDPGRGTSTGPHVHWDIIKGEKMDATSFNDFIDPWGWLQSHQAVVEEIPAKQQEQLLPFQRKVGSAGVNHRDAPNTLAHIRKEWAAGEVLDIQGYVEGQDVNGSNKWFVGKYTGGFLHSRSFNDTDTHDLPNLTAKLFPAQSAPQVIDPPEVPVMVSYEKFDAELDCVTKVVPAHVTNYQHDGFPIVPTEVVIHDYGTDGRDTTTSAHNHFRAENTTAPHFSVDQDGIYQHGRLIWRMFHAGPLGNDKIGIEVHPDVDTNPRTQANLKVLLLALDRLFGKLKRRKHSEYMNTLCGDDIQVSRFWLEAMYPGDYVTTTTSTTTAIPVTTTTTTAIIPPHNGGYSMKSVSKAIAGVIAGYLTLWLAKHNIVISDNLPDVIEMLIGSVIVGLGVYFAPKNKEKK